MKTNIFLHDSTAGQHGVCVSHIGGFSQSKTASLEHVSKQKPGIEQHGTALTCTMGKDKLSENTNSQIKEVICGHWAEDEKKGETVHMRVSVFEWGPVMGKSMAFCQQRPREEPARNN